MYKFYFLSVSIGNIIIFSNCQKGPKFRTDMLGSAGLDKTAPPKKQSDRWSSLFAIPSAFSGHIILWHDLFVQILGCIQ